MIQFPDCLQVDVTSEDIAQGCPKDSAACPIARAVQRCTASLFVSVAAYIAIDDDDRSVVMYRLPPEARLFIEAFDHDEFVAPFSFEARRCDEDRR